jgi:hypothetical protein
MVLAKSVSRVCDISSGIGPRFPLATCCKLYDSSGKNYVLHCYCLILSVHTQLIWAGSVTAEAVPKTNSLFCYRFYVDLILSLKKEIGRIKSRRHRKELKYVKWSPNLIETRL